MSSTNSTNRSPRFLVVNNGLKDLAGHYFETSVSTAEAARRLGMQPLLAAHVSCPADLAPDWLPCFPICRTDHWMATPFQAPSAGVALNNLRDAGKREFKRLLKKLLPSFVLQPTRALHRGVQRWRTNDGMIQEEQYLRAYEEDLARLLPLAGITAGDHLFMPTAHARELLAVRNVLQQLSAMNSPTVHLEFRHALDLDDPVNPSYVRRHLALFERYRRQPHDPRIRLYTDSEELREEYEAASGLPFAVLPVPFRTDRLRRRERKPDEPLSIVFLGDVRDEKGFHLLPPLVEALREEAAAGQVRFVFQATLISREGNPESLAALKRLRKSANSFVKLVGLEGPLTPDEYYDLISAADVLLCPYNPVAYRRRTSGTMTEAVAAGIPTVVPRGTWLENRLPRGAGESFADLAEFIADVRRIVHDYSTYHRAAQDYREEWLSIHTPENLVRQLLA